MSENLIKRINELQDDFFKNVIEEKVSADHKTSIFDSAFGEKDKELFLGSVASILKNNSDDNKKNDEIKKKNDEIKKQIDEAKQKKSENEQNIRTTEQTISKTESSISSTKSEIVSLKGKLAELHEPQQSEYMTYKDGEEVPVVDETAYTAALVAYRIEKANLENQIEQKEQELQKLEENLNTAKNELTTLKGEQTSIDSEISTLEQQLAANELQENTNEEPDKQEKEKEKEKEEEKEKEIKEKEKEKEETAKKAIEKEKLNNIQNSANKTAQKLIQEASDAGLQLSSMGNLFASDADTVASSIGKMADAAINNALNAATKSVFYSNNMAKVGNTIKDIVAEKTVQAAQQMAENFVQKMPQVDNQNTVKSTKATGNSIEVSQTYEELEQAVYSSNEKDASGFKKLIGKTVVAAGIEKLTDWLVKDIDGNKKSTDKDLEKSSGDNANSIPSQTDKDAKACIEKATNTAVEKTILEQYKNFDSLPEDKQREIVEETYRYVNMALTKLGSKIDPKTVHSEEELIELIRRKMEEVKEETKGWTDKQKDTFDRTIADADDATLTRIINKPSNFFRLIDSGRSSSEITNLYTNPEYYNNLDKIVEMIESGVSYEHAIALINNPNYANEMPNIIKLAEMGRSISEILEIINNPNCRKAMGHVIKMVEMGLSSSEITKIFNNPNALMNLNETVELVSYGKKSDEIIDILNDANSVGNLQTSIKLAKMNLNAKNIKGLLNDSDIKNILTNKNIFEGKGNTVDNTNEGSHQNNTEDKFKENKESEKVNYNDDENIFNLYNSIVSGMEFNNVKEKDVYKIINGDGAINNINESIDGVNTDNKLNVFEQELRKKIFKKIN